MKKLIKKYYKDAISLVVLTIIFVGLVKYITNDVYLYGSVLDWSAQHAVIPDYFRTLFYNTKEIFPDFAFNIGGGQNIYNLSYYGLLSPIILISYLLPKVPMVDYICISTMIIMLVSTYLMYLFLKSKKFSSGVSFLACLSFMLSSISFHSHRHIMFMNYMPFLIMGLFGVDKKFDKGKSWLLILSVFLMVLTSYYFSVGGIVCLFLYAFIRYLKEMNKVTVKSFFQTFFKILCPILVGICASAILIIPTLATILYNRADSNIFITLKDLLIPSLNRSNLLYDSYGLGLTSIVIFAIINLFTKKNKESIILGIVLTLFIIFNLFNYIFNGTMYIDSKSLIPLLPIYVLVIAQLYKDIIDKKINVKVMLPSILVISLLMIHKYSLDDIYVIDVLVVLISMVLYYKFSKKILLFVPIGLFIIYFSFDFNNSDKLTLKYNFLENANNLTTYIDNITDNDNSFYRISSNISITEFPNAIFSNIDYYHSTIYSSVSNQTYNKFYFDTLMNNIPSRNRALTVTNKNLLSLMLLSNKYLINNEDKMYGYELINSYNGTNIYKSNNVLPLGFATGEVMSYKDFYELSDQEAQEALLNVIVANRESNNSFVSKVVPIKLDLGEILKDDNVKKEKDGSYSIYVKDNLKINYELPEIYRNKILFIRFKMNKESYNKDLIVTINGVKNKLTASSWKYYNGNTVFDYVLAYEKQERLVFNFSAGDYNISDFEFSVLDYVDIENVSKKVDSFYIDKDETKGDIIKGKITVSNNGYFMASIPYDKGFIIKVDDNIVDYEKVDDGFIGFPIKEGLHNIEIEYKAPLKDVGMIISGLGIIAFVLIVVLEAKKRI